MRRSIAIFLCCCPVWAQNAQYAPVRPQGNIVTRPYRSVKLAPPRLTNSAHIRDFIRAGKIYLTAQDAIELALENNIDIEVARYNFPAAEWQLERSQAGGALAGVPSGSSQAFSVASGQGVVGSQKAAGVAGGGGNGTGNNTSNATVAQIGPVSPVFDPLFQEVSTFSHQTAPQENTTQSLTIALISNTRANTGTFQQGYVLGGQYSVTYKDNYLNENSPTDILNPSTDQSATVSVQQNFLKGFGIAVNERLINVNKLNLNTTDLNFKTEVTGVVVNVLDNYYALVADYEDVRAKESALKVAQQFYEDSRKQLEFGTLTPLDVTNAQTQVVASRQNLDLSQTALEQQDLQLKNLISRTGIADPLLAEVPIVPLDRIEIAAQDEIPPLNDLMGKAVKDRSDLEAERNAIKSEQISSLGTANGIRPTLAVFGQETQTGLAGKAHPFITPYYKLAPDPSLIGGTGTVLGQIFSRDFPSELGGVVIAGPIHNNQAQADYGIDQLQLRQRQLMTRKDENQAEVDVLNAVIALRQARAKHDAAVRNRILNEQLLAAEQQKYTLGASTPYLVVQAQRDLTNAQSSEIAALVDYSNAKIALEQATGTTLEKHNVNIAAVKAK